MAVMYSDENIYILDHQHWLLQTYGDILRTSKHLPVSDTTTDVATVEASLSTVYPTSKAPIPDSSSPKFSTQETSVLDPCSSHSTREACKFASSSKQSTTEASTHVPSSGALVSEPSTLVASSGALVSEPSTLFPSSGALVSEPSTLVPSSGALVSEPKFDSRPPWDATSSSQQLETLAAQVPMNCPLILRLFDLRTPFLMDAAAAKVGKAMLEKHHEHSRQALDDELVTATNLYAASALTKQARKATKRMTTCRRDVLCSSKCTEKNEGGMQSCSANEEETAKVIKFYESVCTFPGYKSLFPLQETAQDYLNNNKSYREAGRRVLDSTTAERQTSIVEISGNNDTNKAVVVNYGDKKYVVPPHCSYWQTDVSCLSAALSYRKYKVMVMDPPWENKHVKRARGRKHGYDMLSVEAILRLPVRLFLRPDSVVLIWATNSAQILRLFQAGLEASWGLTIVQTWYWIKVTRSGSLIRDVSLNLSGRGKLPYERLFVALPVCRVGRQIHCQQTWGAMAKYPLDSSEEFITEGRQERISKSVGKEMWDKKCNSHSGQSCSQAAALDAAVEKMNLIISVPSAVHSHKPPLDRFLQSLQILPTASQSSSEDNLCLEVFARYLLPHCHSIGLEVLRLQQLHLYLNS